MILSCNYEELQALSTGAEMLLEGGQIASMGAVAAPAEAMAGVALLRPRLAGTITVDTLAEQRWMRKAVAAICRELHERMDETILEFHPAHEEAVAFYFDYAHAYGVLSRLDEIGAEMSAIVELITGDEPSEASAQEIRFND